VVFDILREVRREANRNPARPTIYVNASPTVADMMYGEEMASLETLEQKLQKRLVVRAMGTYHIERYEVYSR
jgi:Ribonuclease G/E